MRYDTQSTRVEMHQMTIEEIVRLNREGRLCANPDYHSDRVWKDGQMRLFIDSILRGCYISPICANRRGDNAFDIIDGYQRVKALRCFVDGDDATSQRGGQLVKVGALYNPRENRDMPEFPRSSDGGCWWGGKKFTASPQERRREEIEFSSDERSKFMNTKIVVAIVECKPEKARDMFIRLQRGKPLEPQDIRDTYRSEFSDIVRELGGMLEHEENGHKPHNFFCTGGQGSGTARRKWIAEVAALQLSRMGDSDIDFVDIRSPDLDYYARSEFAFADALPDGGKERLRAIFDKLEHLFPVDKRKQMLKGDIEGIHLQHLFLFVDMLMDNYASKWEEKIVDAHTRFAEEAGKADAMRKQGKGVERDILTYCESAAKSKTEEHSIRRRHLVYVRKMLGFMGDAIKWAHSDVPYRRAGMEFVFYRDNGKCRKCGGDVNKWADAEIHPPLNGKQQPPLDECKLVHKGECPCEKAED